MVLIWYTMVLHMQYYNDIGTFWKKLLGRFALLSVFCGRMALDQKVLALSAFNAGSRVHVWEAFETVPLVSIVCVLLSVASIGF